jgi:hypothetical protein
MGGNVDLQHLTKGNCRIGHIDLPEKPSRF